MSNTNNNNEATNFQTTIINGLLIKKEYMTALNYAETLNKEGLYVLLKNSLLLAFSKKKIGNLSHIFSSIGKLQKYFSNDEKKLILKYFKTYQDKKFLIEELNIYFNENEFKKFASKEAKKSIKDKRWDDLLDIKKRHQFLNFNLSLKDKKEIKKYFLEENISAEMIEEIKKHFGISFTPKQIQDMARFLLLQQAEEYSSAMKSFLGNKPTKESKRELLDFFLKDGSFSGILFFFSKFPKDRFSIKQLNIFREKMLKKPESLKETLEILKIHGETMATLEITAIILVDLKNKEYDEVISNYQKYFFGNEEILEFILDYFFQNNLFEQMNEILKHQTSSRRSIGSFKYFSLQEE